MNAPKIEERVFLLPDEQKVHIEDDTKIEAAANFTIVKEDHTIGNPIRVQLLRDPQVLFAGYRMPHPLEDKMRLKIQTASSSSPSYALQVSLTALKDELKNLNHAFDNAVMEYKNEESTGQMQF